jgi:hypothetical protein
MKQLLTQSTAFSNSSSVGIQPIIKQLASAYKNQLSHSKQHASTCKKQLYDIKQRATAYKNWLYYIEQHLPIQAGTSSITSSNIYLFRQEPALSHQATSTHSGRNQLYHS